jgi:hypothetical protein
MKIFRFLCIAVASIFSASAVQAQTVEASHLRGIQGFSVVIEDLSSSAQQCGITRQELDTSLRFILSQSKIIIDKDQGAIIDLNVTVSDNCDASVVLKVITPAKTLITNKVLPASIWRQGMLILGHAKIYIDSAVEDLAKKLVVDWSSVNT